MTWKRCACAFDENKCKAKSTLTQAKPWAQQKPATSDNNIGDIESGAHVIEQKVKRKGVEIESTNDVHWSNHAQQKQQSYAGSN